MCLDWIMEVEHTYFPGGQRGLSRRPDQHRPRGSTLFPVPVPGRQSELSRRTDHPTF